MGLRINTNIPALGAQRNINQTNRQLGINFARLSTLRRINTAADDAAGLAISELFTSQIRQDQVERNNIQSGINAARTAEGGLGVQAEAVQRIRELSLQASNGTLSDENRAALNAEAQQLLQQIDDVAQDTEFNGQQLLSTDQTIDLGTTGSVELELQESTTSALGLDTLDISTAAGATAAIESSDAALTAINDRRANIGAQENRFESAINQRAIAEENTQAARSFIRDADLARLTIQQTSNQILLQSGLSSLIQSNVTPQTALGLLT